MHPLFAGSSLSWICGRWGAPSYPPLLGGSLSKDTGGSTSLGALLGGSLSTDTGGSTSLGHVWLQCSISTLSRPAIYVLIPFVMFELQCFRKFKCTYLVYFKENLFGGRVMAYSYPRRACKVSGFFHN